MKRLFLALTGWFLCLTLCAQSPQYKFQYWFDGDYVSNITDSNATGVWQTQMEISHLSAGFHTLYLHFQDTTGRWSSPRSYLFYHAGDTATASGFNYACWFDQDYTHRNEGILGNDILLEVGSLSDGFHTLNVQTGSGSGSALQSFLFYKIPMHDSVNTGVTCKFWFDQDYSHHTENNASSHVLLDVSTLSDGFHTLNMQTGSSNSAVLQSFLFYKTPAIDSVDQRLPYFCWFNEDLENTQSGELTGGHLLVDVSALHDGLNTINIQIGSGHATMLKSALFYKTPVQDSSDMALTYVCWFDDHYDTRTSGDIGTGNLLFDVSDLADGFHTVNMQIGGGRGAALQSWMFYKTPVTGSINDSTVLTWHYTIDGREYQPITVTPNQGLIHLELNVDSLMPGLHGMSYYMTTPGGAVSGIKTAYFYRSGTGIKRYEYWFNEQDTLKTIVNIAPQDTLQIITMLSVPSLPIRSTCFQFDPNDGNPVIYAKNDITLRFWTGDSRFVDRKAYYVDENVRDTVVADTIERNTTLAIAAPTGNSIHWFKLSAGSGDSLIFNTNKGCVFQLYSPNGELILQAEGGDAIVGRGCHVWEEGLYYLAVHNASASTDSLRVTYQWIYKYAVLAHDGREVGNDGLTAITLQGNGFGDVQSMRLVKNGSDTIFPVYIVFISNTMVMTYFEFEQRDTGWYNLQVLFIDETIEENRAVHVVPYEEGELISQLLYQPRSNQLEAEWTLKVVNTGNTALLKAPLYVHLSAPRGGDIEAPRITIRHHLSGGIIRHDSLPVLNRADWDSVLTDSDYDDFYKWVEDNYGHELLFIKNFEPREDNPSDTCVVRSNYFFCNIAPHDTLYFKLNARLNMGGHQYYKFIVSVVKKEDHRSKLSSDYCYYGRPDYSQGGGGFGGGSSDDGGNNSGDNGGGNSGDDSGGDSDNDNGGNSGDDSGGDSGDNNGGDSGDDNGGDSGDDNGGDSGDDNGGDSGDDNGGNSGDNNDGHSGDNSGGHSGDNSGNGFGGGGGGDAAGGSGSSSTWCCIHDKIECAVGFMGAIGSAASTASSLVSKWVCNEQYDPTDALGIGADVGQGASNLAASEARAYGGIATIVSRSTTGRILRLTAARDAANHYARATRYTNLGRVFGALGIVLNVYNCYRAFTEKKPNCPPSNHYEGQIEYIAPGDPNDIFGYLSESGSHYVHSHQEELSYTIEFENDPEIASANACRIEVRDTIDASTFDLTSFAATGVTIGDRQLTIDFRQHYVGTIDMRPDINTIAQIELNYDTINGIAHWMLKSLDPMTLEEITNHEQGILPVNSGTNGIGTLSFIINRKSTLSDGARIDNQASIIFDHEDAIMTPTWTNIMDLEDPVSQITHAVTIEDSTTLYFHGTDNRSGIWRYTLYGRVDTTQAWTIVANNIEDSLYQVSVNDSVIYYMVTATDSAGNKEIKTTELDYSTTQGVATYYTVTVSANEGQGIASGGGYIRQYRSATLSATPNYGYHFVSWSDGDTTNPRVITVSRDTTLTALFGINQYLIVAESNNWNGGWVYGGGLFDYLTSDTLYAVAAEHYHFHGWNDGNSDNPRVITVTRDSTLMAVFEIDTHSVSLQTDSAIAVVSGEGSYGYGAQVVVSTHATSPCHHFVAWKDGDVIVSTDTAYTFTIDRNISLTAVYEENVYTGDTIVFSCDSFDWYEHVGITQSCENLTHTFTNVAGCDSVVTLHLTVNYSNTGDTTAVVCDSFDWYEHVGITQSCENLTHTFTNVAGCDSVVTLHLTVNYSNTGDTTAIACDSFDWYEHTDITQSCENLTHTFTNAAGCDSVVTLHLTVNYSNTGDTTAIACDSFDWYEHTGITQSCENLTHTFTNAAGCDSVVTLHLTIHNPVHTAVTETACESFTWNGTEYTVSGDYTFSHPDANGCTQVDTLHLTINNPVHTAVTETACESFTWNGTMYTSSGDYTYSHPDVNGCTQVDTLHLTVNNPVHTAVTENACESFTWNGTTYTVSGDYTYSHTDANGCTQVDTLHLTINNPVHTAVTENACESFTWNGTTYTASGEYTYSHADANGCTQVDTLHLTINNPVHTAVTETACESFTWNGTTYTASGDYTYSHTDANGCTQVDTLHLIINNPVHTTVTETACESFTWNGETYMASGDYMFSHTDANGCTQVDTLHLTINNPVHTAVTETACESFTWNGTTYTVSGDYTYSHTDANGCTQVDTLHLTIFNDETSEFSIVTEDSCYTWNSQSYCASGDYTQTLQTIHGCDSVVTLHLTITVGIDNYDGFDFKVYPNPTPDIVNVECIMKNEEWDGMELHLCDAYGRLLNVIRANNYSPLQTTQIDLSRYASGIYFVKAVADGETIAVRKVVKQ